jgi:undecaprenyl-diphosphatase
VATRSRLPTRRPRRGRAPALAVRHAVALGLLHGPTELLPISSSGHTTLVPWLAGWRYTELEPELRKAFEVALHAGTAAGLLVALRDEVGEAAAELDGRRLALTFLSAAPPAVLALALERPIERRLGTPATIAFGLLAGSALMAVADRAPGAGGPAEGGRPRESAGAVDGLWLGGAQALALVPGVSRNGATLAAARLRGFGREDANVLSRHAALPIITAAALLKGHRLLRRGLPPGSGRAFAAGIAAAFASTLGSTWLIRQVERDRSLAPYAVYRALLAGVVLARLRRGCGR